MDADTLEIRVHETITVQDVIDEMVKAVFDVVKKIWGMLFADPEPESPEENDNDGRSPPDLGINVNEEINTGEALTG